MKAIVMLAILACALGVPQRTSSPMAAGASAGVSLGGAVASSVNRLGMPAEGPSASSVNRQGSFGGSSGSRFPSGGSFLQQRNWGPTAYGPGLNNRFAFPPNPFVMERAIALTKRVPNTLVRVGLDGEVQITDRHGLEVEIVDWFGNDITEGIEEFEFEDGPFGFPGGFGNGFGRGFGNSARGGFGIGLNGF